MSDRHDWILAVVAVFVLAPCFLSGFLLGLGVGILGKAVVDSRLEARP